MLPPSKSGNMTAAQSKEIWQWELAVVLRHNGFKIQDLIYEVWSMNICLGQQFNCRGIGTEHQLGCLDQLIS